jgi:hypothetical protein
VVVRECDRTDISAMRITRIVELPVDGFHISLNDYNAINVSADKIFVQNGKLIFVVLSIVE